MKPANKRNKRKLILNLLLLQITINKNQQTYNQYKKKQERGSYKDEIIVYTFLIIVFGLLSWILISPYAGKLFDRAFAYLFPNIIPSLSSNNRARARNRRHTRHRLRQRESSGGLLSGRVMDEEEEDDDDVDEFNGNLIQVNPMSSAT